VHIDEDTIVFFVNTGSGKGHQLRGNPQAALCFFWRKLGKQVVIEGAVEELVDDEAQFFWQQRPREAALAARISSQGQVSGESRLKDRLHAEKQRYNFVRVERPLNWIGYRLRPERLVFWDTGWQRMRLRTSIQRLADGTWEVFDLKP
jgi:pyridoxamine 5'-phosphate oxidase